MDLISVIVPVYNVEPYLDRCIESIVSQTYKNLEIILVDDGSTDNCPAMCDAWAEKDNRIRVLHIENGGAGNARNKGLEFAGGDWISFFDADDYSDAHMYEYLLSLCGNDVDFAECSIVETYKDTANFSNIEESADKIVVATAQEAMKFHIQDTIFKQTPPNKICRAEIAKAVQFPVGKLIDDEFWTYLVIGQCRRLVHSDFKLYAYRQRTDSAMHKVYSLNRLQAIEAKSKRLNYIQQKFPELESSARVNLWTSCLYHGQLVLSELNNHERKTAFAELKQTLRDYPLKKGDFSGMKMTHKVWILSERVSLYLTCRIRNYIRIGC